MVSWMVDVERNSAKNFSKSLSKTQCFDFCAYLGRAPDCPYFGLACRNFYVNLASGLCCDVNSRCCWLPSWVKDGYHLAVLRGGVLHV
jgi:hypothetical protein